MFFGKIKDTADEWGFNIEPDNFESFVEISEDLHIELINKANSEGKLIKGDENGNPILIKAPEPSEEVKIISKINELESYLSQTDWYVIRFMDTGKAIPDEIKLKRQSVRDELSELKHQSHQV